VIDRLVVEARLERRMFGKIEIVLDVAERQPRAAGNRHGIGFGSFLKAGIVNDAGDEPDAQRFIGAQDRGG
jgi:hypothetical protein